MSHVEPVIARALFAAASATPTNPFLLESGKVMRIAPCSLWSMQVSAVKADGITPGTITSWDVILQPSLDGINFNDMTTPVLEHISTSNAIGDVIFAGAAGSPGKAFDFLQIHCKALVLGGTATQILVTVLGK